MMVKARSRKSRAFSQRRSPTLFAEGIPFVGLSTNAESSLGFKMPAELEAEFKEILAAGGRTLMICDGRCIVEPNYFEVFRKYCGKEE